MAKGARIAPDKKLPRYMELLSDLRGELFSGSYTVGEQFPTEAELCKRYDVSRFTVREALRRLESEGLIARKRGSGTVVQPAAARGGVLGQPLNVIDDLLQHARNVQGDYVRKGISPLPPFIASHVEHGTEGEWVLLRGVRSPVDAAGPIARVDAFLHASLGDIIDRLDVRSDTPLVVQIEQLGGPSVGRVTQDIQAVAASPELAEDLGVTLASPVLRIVRYYLDADDDLFEVSVSHHPGEGYAYSVDVDIGS